MKGDPVERYVQLYEIRNQLDYMGERGLVLALEYRMEDLYYSDMDAADHKALAIALNNLGG